MILYRSTEPAATPEELEALKAALAEAQGELAVAKAKAPEDQALIAHPCPGSGK